MKIDGTKVCFFLKSRANVLWLEKCSLTSVQQIFTTVSFRSMPVGTNFNTVRGWDRRGQKSNMKR